MSFLSTALNRLSERHNLKQADVARDSGLTKSHVSRIFSGDQKTVTDEDFIAIAKAFARDPKSQAELVMARCMDARTGPGSDLVEIRIYKATGSAVDAGPSTTFQSVELAHETEKAFAWLRSQCPLNPDLERHLVGFAKLTGMR
jgi:transcriptional regulator with XRE-family HTH domain